MIHVKLVKVSSRKNRPKGLDDGYTVLGHTSDLPIVGQRFRVMRYNRNGVKVLGIMQTSLVVSLKVTKRSTTFRTENSTYRLTILAPVARHTV